MAGSVREPRSRNGRFYFLLSPQCVAPPNFAPSLRQPSDRQVLNLLADYNHDKARYSRHTASRSPSRELARLQIKIVTTTRQHLVDSIWEAVDERFSDWRVSGPAPPETVVFHLVAEILARVSPSDRPAHQNSQHAQQ